MGFNLPLTQETYLSISLTKLSCLGGLGQAFTMGVCLHLLAFVLCGRSEGCVGRKRGARVHELVLNMFLTFEQRRGVD